MTWLNGLIYANPSSGELEPKKKESGLGRQGSEGCWARVEVLPARVSSSVFFSFSNPFPFHLLKATPLPSPLSPSPCGGRAFLMEVDYQEVGLALMHANFYHPNISPLFLCGDPGYILKFRFFFLFFCFFSLLFICCGDERSLSGIQEGCSSLRADGCHLLHHQKPWSSFAMVIDHLHRTVTTL